LGATIQSEKGETMIKSLVAIGIFVALALLADRVLTGKAHKPEKNAKGWTKKKGLVK
jgi:hypothetical protein